MTKTHYISERLEAENHSPEVSRLVVRYAVEDTIGDGDEALAARIAVCVEAHETLPPDDFRKFLAAIVLREAMEKEPSLRHEWQVIEIHGI